MRKAQNRLVWRGIRHSSDCQANVNWLR
jgi:hypothetical protein